MALLLPMSEPDVDNSKQSNRSSSDNLITPHSAFEESYQSTVGWVSASMIHKAENAHTGVFIRCWVAFVNTA